MDGCFYSLNECCNKISACDILCNIRSCINVFSACYGLSKTHLYIYKHMSEEKRVKDYELLISHLLLIVLWKASVWRNDRTDELPNRNRKGDRTCLQNKTAFQKFIVVHATCHFRHVFTANSFLFCGCLNWIQWCKSRSTQEAVLDKNNSLNKLLSNWKKLSKKYLGRDLKVLVSRGAAAERTVSALNWSKSELVLQHHTDGNCWVSKPELGVPLYQDLTQKPIETQTECLYTQSVCRS